MIRTPGEALARALFIDAFAAIVAVCIFVALGSPIPRWLWALSAALQLAELFARLRARLAAASP